MGLWKARRGLLGSNPALYAPAGAAIGIPTFTTTNKNAGITLSSGNTEADWASGSGIRNVFATKEFIGGVALQHVFAIRLDAKAAATSIRVGPMPSSSSSTVTFGTTGAQPHVYDIVTGDTRRNGGVTASPGAAADGDIVMIGLLLAVSTGNCHVIFGLNGTWFIDPADIATNTGANPGVNINVNYRNGVSANATGAGLTLLPWPYAVPSGFTAPGDV